ncbi:MAG: hypothetical protein RJB01_57 [Actinomycetota bacterium]
MTDVRIPCAGAVCFDQRGRLLLIQRGHEPAQGQWTLPGGRCEVNEASESAVVREVREETGLEVEVIRYVGTVERAAATDRVYVIDDFLVAVTGGTLRPGDDANDAAWVPVDALTEWDLTEGLLDALRAWGLLGVNVGEGA